jgi:acyl-coenzyme A synthetase/AMP-(fatty) acid ligase/thioesterase domain-containing protein/acyl carrier protein
MLDQVPPAVVLTTAALESALASTPPDRWRGLRLDQLRGDAPSDRRSRIKQPDDWSLVIFTSGSTGRPKGVTFTFGQSAAAALATRSNPRYERWRRSGVVYGIVAEHQWLAGYGGIVNALGHGSVVAHYATRRRGPGDLLRFHAEHRVEVTGGVPSLFRAALDLDPTTSLPDVSYVALIGDALRRDLAVDLFERLRPGAIVATSYASSEAGGVASLELTADAIPDGDIVPAGDVVEGVEVEIEDPDEDGVGRIVVVTSGGSAGYARDQGDGDVIEDLGDHRKRHRTGDLGRIRPDGMLEVRGRYAFLVKVRGQRVDAVEVEAALRTAAGVADVVVGVHPDDPAQRLTAWYVAAPGQVSNVAELRAHLRPLLPAYMVPASYVPIDAIPRGTRGKLDRAALPVPDDQRPDLGHPYEAPVGEVEVVVADAFARILGVDGVGRHDAFFDLGGDSLGAAEVMTLLSATLGRDLPLSVFVEASTPAELAARLQAPDAEPRLIPLQPDGDEVPIYCVHGGGGQVLSFASLADRLAPRRPLIAVQMRQSDRARSLFRVNRLAERYAEEIAERQGDQPCVVAGHSYGGIVAQELSRRLVARGVPVAGCVLLDTGVPRLRVGLVAGAQRRRRALGDADNTTALKEVLYAVHAFLGLQPRPHRLTTERMIAAMWGMGWRRIRTTSVPLVLLRAADDPMPGDPRAWEAHTTSTLDVIDVPGGHHSMLAPPHVDRLAELLSSHLAVELVDA